MTGWPGNLKGQGHRFGPGWRLKPRQLAQGQARSPPSKYGFASACQSGLRGTMRLSRGSPARSKPAPHRPPGPWPAAAHPRAAPKAGHGPAPTAQSGYRGTGTAERPDLRSRCIGPPWHEPVRRAPTVPAVPPGHRCSGAKPVTHTLCGRHVQFLARHRSLDVPGNCDAVQATASSCPTPRSAP